MALESNAGLLTALKHKTRRRILRLMFERDEPMSPIETARSARRPLSNVSYHFRVLAETGAIRLDSTKPKRGSVQHYYVLTEAVREDWIKTALALSSDARD